MTSTLGLRGPARSPAAGLEWDPLPPCGLASFTLGPWDGLAGPDHPLLRGWHILKPACRWRPCPVGSQPEPLPGAILTCSPEPGPFLSEVPKCGFSGPEHRPLPMEGWRNAPDLGAEAAPPLAERKGPRLQPPHTSRPRHRKTPNHGSPAHSQNPHWHLRGDLASSGPSHLPPLLIPVLSTKAAPSPGWLSFCSGKPAEGPLGTPLF